MFKNRFWGIATCLSGILIGFPAMAQLELRATARHYAVGTVTATVVARAANGMQLSSQQISFGNRDDLCGRAPDRSE